MLNDGLDFGDAEENSESTTLITAAKARLQSSAVSVKRLVFPWVFNRAGSKTSVLSMLLSAIGKIQLKY